MATGPPATMGPAGFWLDVNGDLAATDPQGRPQVTPGMAASGGGVQRDERGRYYVMRGSQRSYISPVAMGQASGGPDARGVFHQGSQWNQDTGSWDNPIDWGNVLSIGIATMLTAGAATAAFGGGAAGGAAAGTLAPTIPTTTLGTVTPLAGAVIPGAAAAAIPATTLGTLSPLAGATMPSAAAGAIPATTLGTLSPLPGATAPGALAAAPAAAPALLPRGGDNPPSSFDDNGNFTGPSTVDNLAGTGSRVGSIANRILQGAGGYEGLIADVLNGIGAWQQSQQIQNAAQTQIDFANRALDLQKQVYADQQKNQAPYMALGQQSAGRLMNLQPYTQSFRPGGGSTGIQPFAPGMDTGSGPTNNANLPIGGGPSLGSLGNSPSAQRPGAGVDFVTVEGPDGSKRQMPRIAADQFVKQFPAARILG